MPFESPIIKSEETLRQEILLNFKAKVDSYNRKFLQGLVTYDKHVESEERKIELTKAIKSAGLKPQDYLFWHILNGTTPKSSPDFMEFDTVDGKIEKLVDELSA